VVHRHRLARGEDEGVDAELLELPLALEVVEHNGDRPAPVDVAPLGVAHVEHVPALTRRREPVLALLQPRLGNRHARSLT
jgi:hypothetical protein